MPIFEREETLVKKIFVLCALLLFPVLCAAAPAERWTEYVNDRFGYSVEHPDIFEEAGKPENGDGVWLSSKDGKYELTLSGGWNVLGDDGESRLKSRLENVAHVSVQESEKGWYRLVYGNSGKDGAERVVYEYAVVNEEAWASFILSWPKDEDARFRVLIARMEKSLSLPKGE